MVRFLYVFPILLLLAGCESQEAKLEKCFQKGVTYFKSLNRYPRLTNWNSADDLVRKQCTENLTAY